VSDRISFEVRGLPVPQGNLRAFVHGGVARISSKSPGPLAAWRHAIAAAAQPFAPPALWEGPLAVQFTFRLPQPKSRSGFAGRGKDRHVVLVYPDRRPDLDKLVRAAFDALTNVVWKDDCQVVDLTARKEYGTPGLDVYVNRIA
jgi:Holliday junction resolvase RusA-like endonuclease